MPDDNFSNYHSLKLIEALTSLLEQKPINRDAVDYLKHTLSFIPWSPEIHDAWVELLKQMNANLNQLEDFDTHHQELLEYFTKFEKNVQKFEILELIIVNAFQLNRYDISLEYVNKQIEISKENNNLELQSRSYHTKGVLYHVSDQIDKAEEWYERAYQVTEKLDNYKIKDQALYALANLHQHYLSNYETALNYYEEGYNLAKKEEDIERETFYLDHMGMANYELERYEMAIEYHDKASNLLEKQPRSINVLFHKVQLSMALAKLDKFQRVGEELASVIDLQKNNTDAYSNTWYLLLMSQFASRKPNNFKEVQQQFETELELQLKPVDLLQQAQKVAHRSNHIPSIVNTNISLAQMKMNEDLSEAKSLLSEAKELAIQKNRQREIASIKKIVNASGLDYSDL